MDEMFALIGIGLAVFIFCIVLLGMGSFYGGSWEVVAQGVIQFILIIVGFAFAAYVLVRVVDKW